MTELPVRRSKRATKKTHSIYDDAKKQLDIEESNFGSDADNSDSEGEETGFHETPKKNKRSKTDDTDRVTAEGENSTNHDDEPITDSDEDRMSETGQDESDSESSDDSDFEAKPKRIPSQSPDNNNRKPKVKAASKVTPTSKKVTPTKRNPIHVQLKRTPQKSKTRNPNQNTTTKLTSSLKSIQTALTTLSKKVLDKSETTQNNSLLASLLSSYKSNDTSPPYYDKQYSSFPHSIYTNHLYSTSSRLIRRHNSNPNAAQIDLFNLIFRSVGGSVESNLPSSSTTTNPDRDEEQEEIIIEHLTNEDWGEIVTKLVDEMRHTAVDCILLSSDPMGAVHNQTLMDQFTADESNSGKNISFQDIPIPNGSLGVREYRKIYEEFWYRLADVAMVEGAMSSRHLDMDDAIESSSEEETLSVDDGKKKQGQQRKGRKQTKTSSSSTTARFDTELVQELLTRITELTSVGQPDIRSAATVAAMSIARAIIDKTLFLTDKIEKNTRLITASLNSSKNKTNTKAETLKHSTDSMKRSKSDLQEIVLRSVIEGVFVHRYHDSNMFIRVVCLDSLSHMMISRPDMFLADKYLKYFAWMMSDKVELVRIAALDGLWRPLDAVITANKKKLNCPIDLRLLENVFAKFILRIADCVIDIRPSVQEHAMKLLLALIRTGLLDELDDDKIWNQINLMALSHDTTPTVRRDALYFVMEQLEAFDEGDDLDGDTTPTKRNKGKQTKAVTDSERMAVQKLDAIASWAAHILTDGPVPLEKIQIHLVDYIVESLRNMPQHFGLVTNWSAILRAIADDNVTLTSIGTVADDKADVAKQRVLVRILATSARAEVVSVKGSDFFTDDDSDLGELSLQQDDRLKKVNKSQMNGLKHETLSVVVLKSLSSLIEKFKSDNSIVESLTILPRLLIPTVFSLPQRKSDFISLIKCLGELYLQSTSEVILLNIVKSIVYLCKHDHARSSEAKAVLKNVVGQLRSHVLNHNVEDTKSKLNKSDGSSLPDVKKPDRRKSPRLSIPDTEEEDVDSDPFIELDSEYSFYLNLKRLRILSSRFDVSSQFTDDNSSSTEEFYNLIFDEITSRLTSMQSNQNCKDKKISPKQELKQFQLLSDIVHEGLKFLLSLTAWKFLLAQKSIDLKTESDDSEDEDDDRSLNNNLVLNLRNRLISLIELCFDQYISTDGSSDEEFRPSTAQIQFADSVQSSAGDAASDLRTLFPKEWVNASSSLLRSLAIKDDSRLIAGYVRYLRSKEQLLTENDDPLKSYVAAQSLLLPLGRSLAFNWKLGNRREAGVILSHITGHGDEASKIVMALSDLLIKIEPVRLLEAHMAALRDAYDHWFDEDPDEITNSYPSDAEMKQFEEAEERHGKQFEAIRDMAQKFSASLGIRQLSDERLVPAMLGFIREGIRFSFSTTDDLVFGSRLSFLRILSQYSFWAKKNKAHLQVIKKELHENEIQLVSHEEYGDVHEDDLNALFEFRQAIGVGESEVLNKAATEGTSIQYSDGVTEGFSVVEDDESQDQLSAMKTPSTRRTPSLAGTHGSSVASSKSYLSSLRGSLAPLYEEGSNSDEEDYRLDSKTPVKRKSRGRYNMNPSSSGSDEKSEDSESGLGRSLDSRQELHKRSQSSYLKTQSTYDGEISSDDEGSSYASGSPLKKAKRK